MIRFVKISFFSFIVLFLFFCINSYAQYENSDREIVIAKSLDSVEDSPENSNTSNNDASLVEEKYPKGLDAVTVEKKEEKENQIEVDSYFRYMPSSDTDAIPGKITLIKAEAEYSYQFKLFERLPVQFSLNNEYIGISNKQTQVPLPSRLTGFSTDVETTLPFFFKNTYFRLGVSPSWYSDRWSFDTTAFRVPSRYFAIYQPNDKWTWIGGIAVYPDFKDKILPIFGCIYKHSDKLTFNIIPDRPNITYDINDRFSIFGEADLADSEFEVAREEEKNVVLRYHEFNVAGGLKFNVNKFISTSVSLGGVFSRYLKYRDRPGKVNIDNGFYSEFRLQASI